MKTSLCRSCGASIIWAVTSTGRKMPLDAQPVPSSVKTGRFRLTLGPDDSVLAQFVPAYAEDDAEDLHLSHFATCPQSPGWRKSR